MKIIARLNWFILIIKIVFFAGNENELTKTPKVLNKTPIILRNKSPRATESAKRYATITSSNKRRPAVNSTTSISSSESRKKISKRMKVNDTFRKNYELVANSTERNNIKKQSSKKAPCDLSIIPKIKPSNAKRSLRLSNISNQHSDGESYSSASSVSSTSSLNTCSLIAPCSIRFDKTKSQMARSTATSTFYSAKSYLSIPFDKDEISTSTPLISRKKFIQTRNKPEDSVNTAASDLEIIEQDSCDNAAIYLNQMDQSTQVLADQPVLVESTFNTSSLSNLSDDLLILQTAPEPKATEFKIPLPLTNGFVCSSTLKKPKDFKKSFENVSFRKAIKQEQSNLSIKQHHKDWNSIVMSKFHENTNCSLEGIPEWADGTNLKIALVNQAYFNPNAKGIFIH